ncbi:hypothetical protein H4219_004926 [Mycoemilia scoparia]|uniref:Uncharacterized protein n=1 Tax=Mycoemilia scoparia TaxID=417184 RepID=A0A9W7ZPX1_9FUNG|nr:hypothetical protein H4219_004926 [Mycoemilia scoparia]
MSQRSQPPPSMTPGPTKSQIDEIFLFLSENGCDTFELTQQERDNIDPSNFGKSMRYIIKQWCAAHANEIQPGQFSGNRKMTRYCPACEKNVEFRERFDQPGNFFDKTNSMLRNIDDVLDGKIAKPEDPEDFQQAYERCFVATSNMRLIGVEIKKNGGKLCADCYEDYVVSFLEELVKCVPQFAIVRDYDVNLLEYDDPAPDTEDNNSDVDFLEYEEQALNFSVPQLNHRKGNYRRNAGGNGNGNGNGNRRH